MSGATRQVEPAADETILVLHVDDDHGIVDLSQTFLEREGLEVVTATDATTGLDLLAERPIECVVSDYDMPGTDGLEFLAAVRDRDPDLPFLLFTGKGSEGIASEAISRGVTDYLQKEPGTDQYAVLANRIEGAVRRYRAETELAEARRRYETLLANLPGMVYRCTTAPGWPMTFVSEGCRSVTGYDPSAITSGEVDFEADVIVEDDRPAVREAVETAVEDAEPFEVTYRVRRRDGEVRWVWEQGRAVADADHDEVVLEGFITDVTARERNERELRTVSATQRAVLQRVRDGVLVLDPAADRIVEANAAAADLLDRTGTDLVDAAPADLLAPDDADLASLATQESVERNLTLATGDGDARTLSADCRALAFEDGRRLVIVLRAPDGGGPQV